MQNQVVTVHGVGYKLGSHKPLADQAHREGMGCSVMDCNAHYVTLMNIASNRHELYNREWLIERHGHRSPAEARRAFYAAAEKLAA